jgi:hypothetical protein
MFFSRIVLRDNLKEIKRHEIIILADFFLFDPRSAFFGGLRHFHYFPALPGSVCDLRDV